MSIALKKFEKFASTQFKDQKADYAKLADGQAPKVLFITCSDSRVMPTDMTQSKPGELFVIRNAGNLVPKMDENKSTSEALTVQYAVEVLKVEEIVVCGHVKCGAMAGILDLDKLTGLKEVHKHLESCSHQFDSYELNNLREDSNRDKALQSLIEKNVSKQIENLKSYDFISKRVGDGSLKIYGWVYDFVNGKIVSKPE